MQEAKHFLARLLQLSLEELDQALKAKYSYTFIRKRASGEYRRISIPEPALKKVQRRILRRILYRASSPMAINGFRPGSSIVSNANLHLLLEKERKNSIVRHVPPYILRIDLKDAFGTVSEALYKQFRDQFCQKILDVQQLRKAKIRLAIHRRYSQHYWNSDCRQRKELSKINTKPLEDVDRFLKQVLKSKKIRNFDNSTTTGSRNAQDRKSRWSYSLNQ